VKVPQFVTDKEEQNRPFASPSFEQKTSVCLFHTRKSDTEEVEKAKDKWPVLMRKCKACARRWHSDKKRYIFDDISDEIGALAPISFRSKQMVSEEPFLCEACFTRETRCKWCNKYKEEYLNKCDKKDEVVLANIQGSHEDYEEKDVTQWESPSRDHRSSKVQTRFGWTCDDCKEKLQSRSSEENKSGQADDTISQSCWNLCTQIFRSDCKVKCCRQLTDFFTCSKVKRHECYEETGTRRYNPLWTGTDPSQIGVFIRNLRIVGLDEEKKTITLQFFLNVCWLDEELCDFVKCDRKIDKDAHAKLSLEEYKKYWKDIKGNRRAKGNEYYSNVLPELRIWDVVANGLETRQDIISLNKKWIGRNTVYWRRLVNVELKNSFCSETYPFGYEKFKLTIRLISYTKQSLTLMRTNLWYGEHKKQAGNDIAAHTFSYIVPDKTFMIDWKVCSVHGHQDRWYSKFDHNDLTYRLPVTVSRGQDTQSRFEAWIILKRRPRSVIFVFWVWYTMTSAIALLTWTLDPVGDLADRLAIAVGIIFIQMGLKIHSATKTPRMPNITVMDIHSFLAVFLVVLEAICQALLVQFVEGNPDANEDKASSRQLIDNRICAWINFGLFLLANISTILIALCRQCVQKKTLEDKLKTFTGFKNDELHYPEKGKDIKENRVARGDGPGGILIAVEGHSDRLMPIKINEQGLQERIEKFTLKRAQSNFGMGSKICHFLSCNLCRETL